MSEGVLKKKGKLGLILAAAGMLIVIAVICIVLLCKGKKEYRIIRVTEVTGEVLLHRDNMEGLNLTENMNLQSGDELITEAGAKVVLRLDDDKYLLVDEETKLVLVAEGTKEDSKTRIELEYGAVFSDIKSKLSEKSEYEVTAPSGVMSVRGTQFEVVYREMRDEAGKLMDKVMKVLTFEGEVYVKPEGAKGKRISKAGTMEVLTETEEGIYTFAAETKDIEPSDLSEFSASYLKEELSGNSGDLDEEEKKILETIEAFFDETKNEGLDIAPTPEPTTMPVPSEVTTPEPTPTSAPVEEVDNTLHLQVRLAKVIPPLGNYRVSDMESLYDILEPHQMYGSEIKADITFQDEMNVWLNNIADEYIQNEGAIKDAAEAVYGKEVIVRCNGFYSENDYDKFYGLEEHCTFAEYGVMYPYLTLYPVYTVYVPEDNASYRYVPVRMMITEMLDGGTDEENTFYTFMVQEGTTIGLPEVDGYETAWSVGSRKSESSQQEIMKNQLSWPILLAEKQEE